MEVVPAMSPMTDPPAPADLAYLPNARLLVRTLLLLLAPIGIGALLILALLGVQTSPPIASLPAVAMLALAFLLSLCQIVEASLAWESRCRARRLLAVPLPDAPGLWLPEDLPLSAHGRIILAQAAPVPSTWAIGHDGLHAYVVQRAFGRWQRLARRPR
jgi:hypothetical protein